MPTRYTLTLADRPLPLPEEMPYSERHAALAQSAKEVIDRVTAFVETLRGLDPGLRILPTEQSVFPVLFVTANDAVLKALEDHADIEKVSAAGEFREAEGAAQASEP